uniref:Reverse transcriptase domain-containing protein n=1 Tax=Cannabis sativa TaxID=3483 RepID=A0A803PDG0_CANSA
MKAWDPNLNLKKEDIRTVPIWVQLEDLELKYWGQRSLFKIIGQLDKPVMLDEVTKGREKLAYPRVLIEVTMSQEFPDMISFENEYGTNVSVRVHYEWKPIICKHCKGMGHKADECRKKEGKKQEWVVKEKRGDFKGENKEIEVDKDGFKPNRGNLITKNGLKLENQEEGDSLLSSMDRILSWNVRGINSPKKQQEVKGFIERYKIGLVGLLETRVKASKLGALYVRMFANWCFTSNIAWAKGGRIIVAWNPGSFNVNILFCSSQMIHLHVTNLDNRNNFYVSFVYGYNNVDGRNLLWKEMTTIKVKESWLVLGDFNDILEKGERIGKKESYSHSKFKECVIECQLEDVKQSGSFFTWKNKQKGEDRVYSKIDRIMANQRWLATFLNAEAMFLNEGLFDHTPALLTVYPTTSSSRKPFKYFRMWSSYPSFKQSVEDVWKVNVPGTNMFQVVTKLKALKKVFKQINQQGFSDIQAQDSKAKVWLDEKQAAQKSKVCWIKDGDSNTTFYHASLRERRSQNRINSIINASGDRIDKPEEITETFLEYYKQLMGSKLLTRKKVKRTVISEGPVVTKEQADNLLAEYSREEIKQDVFDISGSKSPGPDGFGSYFFQDNWELIGPEICEAVRSFLQTGNLLKEINSTVITLIPKVKSLNLAAKPNCMIKLDLQKAYDTVEWDFLEEMLHALKFPGRIINLVMICVRTPRFSLMFNGSTHGFFEAKRGLRQGDPMSPLLFVLGMEHLSRIMKKLGKKKDFGYHERCADLGLNNLSFADDVLLFCRVDFKSIYLMMQALKLFSATSGMQPNNAKSAIYYSGMSENEIQRVLDMSGFARQHDPFKYLGVPICARRISTSDCIGLVQKMTARIRIWSTRHLSFAGREEPYEWGWGSSLGKVMLSKKFRGFRHNNFSAVDYKIAEGLNWFSPTWEKVPWSKEVWSRLNIPKHSFLLWLAMINRLKTRDRLFHHGYIAGADCIFCNNAAETTNHIFFECFVAAECLKQVKGWFGWHTTTTELTDLLKWIRKARCSSFKKQVLAAGVAALVHGHLDSSE